MTLGPGARPDPRQDAQHVGPVVKPAAGGAVR